MNDIADIRRALREARNDLSRRQGRREALRGNLAVAEAGLQQAREQIKLLDEVAVVLKNLSGFARDQARDQVERTVTAALRAVFSEDYSFRIALKEVGQRVEAEFYVASRYGAAQRLETKPEDARGGGVVDVVSLALRVAMLLSHQPRVEGPLVLDEPTKHVSREFSPNVTEFLRSITPRSGTALATRAGRQVILVTHDAYLGESADTVYEIERVGDETRVKVLKTAS